MIKPYFETEKICKFCNKVFTRPKNENYKAWNNRLFCSVKCFQGDRRKTISVFKAKLTRKGITKICNVCGKEKEIKEFSKRALSEDGFRYDCKECQKAHDREYYMDKSGNTIFREKRKEYYTKYMKLSSKKEIRNKRLKLYYKHNINAKIAQNLRSRIISAIRFGFKPLKTTKLLGCSIDNFKNYLESKFQKGMSWDNWGKIGWHIDHKIPCSIFDLTDPEQQKQCFHYSNLQPLWAKENISKYNKCESVQLNLINI